MEKPVLVIMAAGMGSRYGGLKQIDPMDKEGHILMDFSLFDAKNAGFEKVIFIIKKENEKEFKERIGNRIEKIMEVAYVYQELSNLPKGFELPKGRQKPFGTGHAILSCLPVIHGPFAVINADDYYGKHAFSMIYDYLSNHIDNDKYQYAMVGYILENTLTENGHVARGICSTAKDGKLLTIAEHTHIEKSQDKAVYTDDDGETWHEITKNRIVSMNLWGFTNSILGELENRFPKFLRENLEKDPLKCEFFLPSVVGELLVEEKAQVQVLTSKDKWYGVTYHEDKPMVEAAIHKMKLEGFYPQSLWG